MDTQAAKVHTFALIPAAYAKLLLAAPMFEPLLLVHKKWATVAHIAALNAEAPPSHTVLLVINFLSGQLAVAHIVADGPSCQHQSLSGQLLPT